MKKTILIPLLFCLQLLSAQDRKSHGFIALTLGPSFPVGQQPKSTDFASFPETGSNINLVNFGYNFGGVLGICGSWFGTAYQLNNRTNYNSVWGYGGLMAGPMATFALSERSFIDFRGMVGFSGYEYQTSFSNKEDVTDFCFNLGTQARLNFAPRWGILVGLDYFNTKTKILDGQNRSLSAINLSFGLIFNFKKVFER